MVTHIWTLIIAMIRTLCLGYAQPCLSAGREVPSKAGHIPIHFIGWRDVKKDVCNQCTWKQWANLFLPDPWCWGFRTSCQPSDHTFKDIELPNTECPAERQPLAPSSALNLQLYPLPSLVWWGEKAFLTVLTHKCLDKALGRKLLGILQKFKWVLGHPGTGKVTAVRRCCWGVLQEG